MNILCWQALCLQLQKEWVLSRDGIKGRVDVINGSSRKLEVFEIYKNLKFTIIFQGIGQLLFREETERKTEIWKKKKKGKVLIFLLKNTSEIRKKIFKCVFLNEQLEK